MAFLQQCGLGLTHVQGPEQVLPVHVPEKDPALAALGTAQDMVNGARLLNAQLARHAPNHAAQRVGAAAVIGLVGRAQGACIIKKHYMKRFDSHAAYPIVLVLLTF